jgi:hypothetical protein
VVAPAQAGMDFRLPLGQCAPASSVALDSDRCQVPHNKGSADELQRGVCRGYTDNPAPCGPSGGHPRRLPATRALRARLGEAPLPATSQQPTVLSLLRRLAHLPSVPRPPLGCLGTGGATRRPRCRLHARLRPFPPPRVLLGSSTLGTLLAPVTTHPPLEPRGPA